MEFPDTYTSQNETGCCAVPNVKDWDEKKVVFQNKRFVRMYTRSFLFVPLNMAKVMTALQKIAAGAGAEMPPTKAMILSRDISPWKAEQLYSVSKEIPSADNTMLDGAYLTKVFEGPYQNAKQWHDSLNAYAKSEGNSPQETYMFYTTCPQCAKHYGKNYTIGLIKIA